MSDLLELAQKCEAAKTADGYLDGQIKFALAGLRNVGGYRAQVIATGEIIKVEYNAPEYTASIDAAMKLVPEGWPIENLSWWPSVPKGYEDQRKCRVTILEIGHDGWHSRGANRNDRRITVEALTPALAICAAALRARDPATPTATPNRTFEHGRTD